MSGETWTLTSQGPQQVKDLTHKCILIVDGQKYATDGFFKSGYKDVYEIVTKEGYRLQATEDHPLLMNSFRNLLYKDQGFFSWSPIKNLRVGDQLKLTEHNNISWSGDGDWADGYLIGSLYGDGSCSNDYKYQNELNFFKNDFCMINFVIKLFGDRKFSCCYNTTSHKYTLKSPYLRVLKDLFGIDGYKIITPAIERGSSDFCKGFISAFFDTDGSSDPKFRCITLSQSDLPRLQAVQRMLLRFGICSSVYRKPDRTKKPMIIKGKTYLRKKEYCLYVGAENTIKFQERIGFKHPEKNERVLESFENCKSQKCRKEYFLVTVKSVNLIGKKTVYDVTVPEKDCFDANGFMAHNCSMRQPGGIGTRVEWAEPDEYIESLLGFKRYFTMENQIVKALFNLANDPPKEWLRMNIKVTRRDREQTAGGALRSALFAAAFAQQAANMRAAANHVIQSTGAQITKRVQRNIWGIQPSGINPFIVQPLNIHDEVLSPTHPDFVTKVKEVVDKTVESFREKVPLIKMDWKSNLKTWADKK